MTEDMPQKQQQPTTTLGVCFANDLKRGERRREKKVTAFLRDGSFVRRLEEGDLQRN